MTTTYHSQKQQGQSVSLPLLFLYEISILPGKNFPCISMDMLEIGALVLLGKLVEAGEI